MVKRVLVLAALLALPLVLVVSPMSPSPAAATSLSQTNQQLGQLAGDAFDQAFLQQMVTHHAMAVLMARPVVANSGRQELKDLGMSIIGDQTREISQMRAWGRDWYSLDIPDPLTSAGAGQPAPVTTPISGMDHGAMPGGTGELAGISRVSMSEMSSDMSLMANLWKLPAPRLDAVFLSLMIPHHQEAIEMADLAPTRAARQQLKDLAAGIIQSQSAEINQMNNWLAAWFDL
jgi:uncharacterized protein (DUF305 family)